jgi:hypothetical protein
VLSTTVRFCDYYGYPGMVALGAFFRQVPNSRPAPGFRDPTLVVDAPPDRPGFSGEMGFAEAHWADIARAISNNGYILQETKAWARTVVNRMRALASLHGTKPANVDYRKIRNVLEEMIDTIALLESLLFLAEKAGLGKFDLKAVLDAYLGDVQLVTDFAPIRTEIVGRFHEVLAAAAHRHPNAEIHVVAHSEGTVVSFLGLLEACDDPARHPWIQRVRGYMTLGSPIDKHLILWPSLFDKFKRPNPATTAQIRWLNYVDYADPVGFDLDTAREWIESRGYARVFQFAKEDDFEFQRYPVPGKAHVDYWADSEVFDHFIRRVIDPPAAPTPREAKWLRTGPRTIWWVPIASYLIGYLIPFVAIQGAVYILCKAIAEFLDPKDVLPHPHLISTVIALGLLISGTTCWLRLLRLTRGWKWFFIGGGIYALSAWAFYSLASHMSGQVVELRWFEAYMPDSWPLGLGTLLTSAAFIVTGVLLDLRRILGTR